MHIFSGLLNIDHKEIQSASETFGMSRAESTMRMFEKQDLTMLVLSINVSGAFLLKGWNT